MHFEDMIRSFLGPTQPYVVIDGRQLYTLTPDDTVVCFLGDYRKWSPDRVKAFVAARLK